MVVQGENFVDDKTTDSLASASKQSSSLKIKQKGDHLQEIYLFYGCSRKRQSESVAKFNKYSSSLATPYSSKKYQYVFTTNYYN